MTLIVRTESGPDIGLVICLAVAFVTFDNVGMVSKDECNGTLITKDLTSTFAIENLVAYGISLYSRL